MNGDRSMTTDTTANESHGATMDAILNTGGNLLYQESILLLSQCNKKENKLKE